LNITLVAFHVDVRLLYTSVFIRVGGVHPDPRMSAKRRSATQQIHTLSERFFVRKRISCKELHLFVYVMTSAGLPLRRVFLIYYFDARTRPRPTTVLKWNNLHSFSSCWFIINLHNIMWKNAFRTSSASVLEQFIKPCQINAFYFGFVRTYATSINHRLGPPTTLRANMEMCFRAFRGCPKHCLIGFQGSGCIGDLNRRKKDVIIPYNRMDNIELSPGYF